MAKLNVDREIRRAQTFERKGDPQSARDVYAAILEAFPGNLRVQKAMDALRSGASSKAKPNAKGGVGGAPGATVPQNLINELIGLYRQQNWSEAINASGKISALFPDFADGWNIQAAACNALGDMDGTARALREVIRLQPNSAPALNNLGVILQQKGDVVAARAFYQRALSAKADYPEAWTNLGVVLRDQGELDAAKQALGKALAIKPDHAPALGNLGNVLGDMGRPQEAVTCYRRALAIAPDYVDAIYNLGNALKRLGQLSASIDCYQKAISLRPDWAEAHYNLGVALKEDGQLVRAVAAYDRAVALRSDYIDARVEKLREQMYLCDWSEFDAFVSFADDLAARGDPVPPFPFLVMEDNPTRQRKRSESWARQVFAGTKTPSTLAMPPQARQDHSDQNDRIRIGYFSSDFHDHATLFLMAGVFAHHDMSRFEIYVYSYGAKKDGVLRTTLRDQATAFFDVAEMSDSEIQHLVGGHSLDVAIDLKGFTENSRSEIFAVRLAPVQIAYVGYPGTMGTDFIDYLIADRVVIPQRHQDAYCEKIIYLPDCYQPNDNCREIAETTTNRTDFGLPEDGFVFCCFNHNYKITPREFGIWMRLLDRVEHSVLWLWCTNKTAEENLRKAASAQGVSPDRLIFAERLPQAEHLARLRHADLFVDTFNVNAHTTASDALWGGLPMVTRAGDQFAARVAASLLCAMDLPELVTDSDDAYESLILDLATQPDRLAKIRTKLEQNRLKAPLFDTLRYTRGLERGIEMAVKRYRKNAPCDHIVVPDGAAQD
ncbi:tetratricopeptide repeat protein [Thalassospira alkalitolerans]|uniref:O-linked N-acetylglucosamine transferase, SPINDLY family protein n=1 Tax=Thalassospira alkalitolerans TaxID=1293890 RepID=UPI003AA85B4F